MEKPGVLLRLIVALLLAVAWTLIYSRVNTYGTHALGTRIWESPVQRWPRVYFPELALPYLVIGLLLPFLPLVYPLTRSGFLRAVISLTTTGIGCLIVYLVYPVKMGRPAYDHGRYGESLMRWVTSMDGPANCLPSSHAAFAVCAAALLTWPDKQPWWIVSGVWFLTIMILISTVSVGQHYIRDTFAGVALGLLSVLFTVRLIPQIT